MSAGGNRFRRSLIVNDGMLLIPALDYLLYRDPKGEAHPFDIHTAQMFPLGSVLEDFATGRRWRYCKNGAGTPAAGVLLQAPVPAADHEDLAVATAVAGASTVTVTNGNTTALTANMYAGGLLWICEGAGALGQAYRIKSHPAADVDAACVITLHPDDTLQTALTAGTHKASLLLNPYTGLIIHDSPPTSKLVGVTMKILTANCYFWAQTRGPAAVLTEGTVVIADRVMASATTDGAVTPYPANSVDAGGLEECVGHVMRVGDTGDISMIYLTLE